IAGLSIETAAFTNLTRDHLDEHGDIEAYGRAKATLFTREGVKRCVLNVDDPFGRALASRLPAGVEAIRVARAGAPGAAAGITSDITADVRNLGLAGL